MRVRSWASAALLTLIAAMPAGAAADRAGTHSGVASPALGIRHVFVIVLENESYTASYFDNPNPWLGRILQQQGTLLTNYYGVGHVSNDNYLAMVSGQAPNIASQSDCQRYVDFAPSPAVFGPDGQAIGQGCVYPPNVLTLADQLTATHHSWRGYMGDMGNDPAREPARCGAPGDPAGTGTTDGTQSAEPKDQYAARHNPFVYFHSLLDTGGCRRNVVPLSALSADLKRLRTTPDLSFITPNLCDDGHDAPCKGKDATGSAAGGLVSVDHFLSVWVPRIEHSPAFGRDGLLVITTDEGEVGASGIDGSSCCGEQPGPNSPLPGVTGLGGGRIGTLVIGRCVRAGAKDTTPYNHYGLLRSLEDIYGVRSGGADGHGHLGYAATTTSFGRDLFAACPGH